MVERVWISVVVIVTVDELMVRIKVVNCRFLVS